VHGCGSPQRTRPCSPRAAGPEIGCDECFDRLDEFVELELAGLDAAAVPGLRAHLEGWPACREEHDALLALAAENQRDTR